MNLLKEKPYEGDTLSLTRIYREVSDLLEETALDHRVVQALTVQGDFLARESHLWDYKRSVGSAKHELCELIKDIVAFHNSYGGYLIIGVSESDDSTQYSHIGVSDFGIDEANLKKLIHKYTAVSVEVSYIELSIAINVDSARIGLLHIPKRAKGALPVIFTTPAADSPTGKRAFNQGSIYLRSGSESRPVNGLDDQTFLHGPREPIGSILDEDRLRTLNLEPPLQNNLPDKNVICPQFVGRENILDDLWQWLSDPFSNVRVLAGDGGKGKTSIAYAFATTFAMKRPGNYQQVVWLSAKQRQFHGLANTYVEMPESHFTDAQSLLLAIAERCGCTDEETSDAEVVQLKAVCRQALTILPALIIVDDVDSLEMNEQKRVMEIANQLTASTSRFLLTTRANITYSNDICITVPGLPKPEYKKFVTSICSRLSIANQGTGEIDRLHSATSGSPLLTESIFRLIKTGMPVSAAIDEWEGQAGQDARDAALKREIEQLSPEARRVLLSMAYLGECSQAEVRHLTNYPQIRLADSISELQNLFLVTAPPVTKDEPRFAVPDLVRSLAFEKRTMLAHDHHKLSIEARNLRKGVQTGKNSNARAVGAAIGQASAQLAQSNVKSAIDTLKTALTRAPKQPELQCFLARLYLKSDPPLINQARDLFKSSHEGGNRRREVFDGWYEAEIQAKHWPGAVHVADLILSKSENDSTWRYRRAYANSQIAITREKSGDTSGTINVYESVADDLKVSIAESYGFEKQERVADAAALNDLLWNRSSTLGSREAFNMTFRSIKRGDIRRVMYARLFESLKDYVASLPVIAANSPTDTGVRGMLLQASDALAQRPLFPKDENFRRDAETQLRALQSTYRAKLDGTKAS